MVESLPLEQDLTCRDIDLEHQTVDNPAIHSSSKRRQIRLSIVVHRHQQAVSTCHLRLVDVEHPISPCTVGQGVDSEIKTFHGGILQLAIHKVDLAVPVPNLGESSIVPVPVRQVRLPIILLDSEVVHAHDRNAVHHVSLIRHDKASTLVRLIAVRPRRHEDVSIRQWSAAASDCHVGRVESRGLVHSPWPLIAS